MAIKVPVGIIKAIDEYFRVNNEIKLLEAEKSSLATTIKQYMENHGLDVVEAKKAQAVYSTREVKEIDPEAYWEAIDGDVDKLLASVTVRMDPKSDRAGARSYLGADDIETICGTINVPVLNVKKLKTQKIVIPKKVATQPKRARRLATA